MNKTDSYIFIKIILVAFFLLILNSWLAYHIGEDFLETYFVNGILVFFAIVSFFLKYLRRGEEEKFNQLYSNWLSGILSFQVIAGFYILFFMAVERECSCKLYFYGQCRTKQQVVQSCLCC